MAISLSAISADVEKSVFTEYMLSKDLIKQLKSDMFLQTCKVAQALAFPVVSNLGPARQGREQGSRS